MTKRQALTDFYDMFVQVLYAGEGESRKPDENATPPVLGEMGDRDKVSTIIMKGHEFVAISFHMPASCESCTKPLWAPFRPPPAVECRSKYLASLDFCSNNTLF